jgi:uncharacterized protein
MTDFKPGTRVLIDNLQRGEIRGSDDSQYLVKFLPPLQPGFRGVAEWIEESRLTRTKRGFGGMSKEVRREIARLGGQTAQNRGVAHRFTSEEATVAGQKGGLMTSQNRQHMSEIGRKGGSTVSQDTAHMQEIGRKGGQK